MENWKKEEENIQTTHLTEGFYSSSLAKDPIQPFFGQCFQLIQLMKKDPEKGLKSVFLDNIVHVFRCWQKLFCTTPKQTPAIFCTRFHEDITQKGRKITTSNAKQPGLFALYRAETGKEEHLSQYSILCNLIFVHLKKEIKRHITDTRCTRLNELILPN